MKRAFRMQFRNVKITICVKVFKCSPNSIFFNTNFSDDKFWTLLNTLQKIQYYKTKTFLTLIPLPSTSFFSPRIQPSPQKKIFLGKSKNNAPPSHTKPCNRNSTQKVNIFDVPLWVQSKVLNWKVTWLIHFTGEAHSTKERSEISVSASLSDGCIFRKNTFKIY